LEHNLGIVQREKLVDVIPLIEEFDPSARDRNVLLRHLPHSISKENSLGLRGEIPLIRARTRDDNPLCCCFRTKGGVGIGGLGRVG
jgi:hypothetical protein